jgi:hypothetical protein
MYTENIIRDLLDIIHDVKQVSSRAYECRHSVERAFVFLGEKDGTESYGLVEDYDILSDSFLEAQDGVVGAANDLDKIEEMLKKIVEDIKMEELSAKVQSK